LDRLDVSAGSYQEPLELRVHAELGQAQLADVARELHLEPRPAMDQDHLVTGKRPADLQAAEKVTHAEHVLAVEYDFHAQRPLIMVFRSYSGLRVREFRVQKIHEGYRHRFRHPPARLPAEGSAQAETIGASGNQAPATASFLNPCIFSLDPDPPLPES
jgi:hypothetical protein